MIGRECDPIGSRLEREQGRSGCAGSALVCWKKRKSQSFPAQLFEIADVSLVEGTIAGCNYWFFFGSPRNGIEEADGSIPFSSTKHFGIFSVAVERTVLGTIEGASAGTEEAVHHDATRPPVSTASAPSAAHPPPPRASRSSRPSS